MRFCLFSACSLPVSVSVILISLALAPVLCDLPLAVLADSVTRPFYNKLSLLDLELSDCFNLFFIMLASLCEEEVLLHLLVHITLPTVVTTWQPSPPCTHPTPSSLVHPRVIHFTPVTVIPQSVILLTSLCSPPVDSASCSPHFCCSHLTTFVSLGNIHCRPLSL